MKENSQLKTILIALALMIPITLISILGLKKCSKNTIPSNQDTTVNDTQIVDTSLDADSNTSSVISVDSTESPEALMATLREAIIEANETKNIAPLLDKLGKDTLSDEQISLLKKMVANSELTLEGTTPYNKQGEDGNNWQLNFTNGDIIELELAPITSKDWKIDKFIYKDIKSQAGTSPDALIPPVDPSSAFHTAESFISSLQKLDPTAASKYVDVKEISYSKIVGLCMIFEEAKYSLIEKKAIREMFSRNTTVGYIVRMKSDNAEDPVAFGVTAKRADKDSPWLITEINLDQFLTDYAKQTSDGETHYTPLIKNPQGGDSLATYFDLDSDQLTTRTKKQLNIVATLLKSTPEKKLTIAGHTDSLGSDPYNIALSKKRAIQVKSYLNKMGLANDQVTIVGMGKSQPQLPNITPSGQDSPEGRRANRRAEILLDF